MSYNCTIDCVNLYLLYCILPSADRATKMNDPMPNLSRIYNRLPKLKVLIAISILVFILHALEEYVTGFPSTDRSFLWIVDAFDGLTFPQSVFILYQISLISLICIIFAVIYIRFAVSVLLIFLGIIFLLETSHIAAAIITVGYYPGVYTSLAFPILSIAYWVRLIFDLRHGDSKLTEADRAEILVRNSMSTSGSETE